MENDLISYIVTEVPELKDHIYPVFTTDTEVPTLVYKTAPISRGVVNETQLEVKIIFRDYDKCLELDKKLQEVLDMSHDLVYRLHGGIRFRSALAGSGGTEDYDVDGLLVFEVTRYYLIRWRKRNNG